MSKDAFPSIDLAALPDDPAVLKRVIVEREQLIAERERQLMSERDELIARIKEEAARQLEMQAQRYAAELKAAVAAILRRYYGPRSERFDPRQLLLFGQRIEEMPLDEASVEDESGERLVTRRIK